MVSSSCWCCRHLELERILAQLQLTEAHAGHAVARGLGRVALVLPGRRRRRRRGVGARGERQQHKGDGGLHSSCANGVTAPARAAGTSSR